MLVFLSAASLCTSSRRKESHHPSVTWGKGVRVLVSRFYELPYNLSMALWYKTEKKNLKGEFSISILFLFNLNMVQELNLEVWGSDNSSFLIPHEIVRDFLGSFFLLSLIPKEIIWAISVSTIWAKSITKKRKLKEDDIWT